MARLFGTDGVRGIANEDITAELAMNIGRAAAMVLTQGTRRRPLVLIGKDTRLSSDMLESALAAGLCSVGADVISVGVLPTPAVAYLVKHYKADASIMISASHNTYAYNGIKIFSGDGMKLPDDLESRIETLVMEQDWSEVYADAENIGKLSYAADAAEHYIEHLRCSVPTSLEGLNIAVDCANGAAVATAEKLFSVLGANVTFLADKPDGLNINEDSGSTHMDKLKAYVVEHGLDAGVAFDGDADRCLCVDEKGNTIDGDFIMAICALDLKERGKLRGNTVVGTIMTNMGFNEFCDKNDIRFIATKVGDRYVLEEMELEGYCFGGEQSGHIIFRDYATTGDGQLTAIQLLCHVKASGKTLSELASVMKRWPQVMRNVPVSRDGRLAFYNNRAVKAIIADYKEKLGDEGRVVVRVSGTEPVIRVMAEGIEKEAIITAVDDIADIISKELK